MTEKVTFGRQGQVRRGKIRVGWIERRDDFPPTTWRLRFTPASGAPGIKGEFERLRDAKAEALRLLEALGDSPVAEMAKSIAPSDQSQAEEADHA